MEAVPDQPGELKAPTPIAFVCPDCGKAYDAVFALSYHRKHEHGVDPFATAPPDYSGALSKIRSAVIAGFISAAVTALLALTGFMGFDAWALFDAAIILGLTIGVWNRSRACAVALFALWIIEKVFQWVTYPGSLTGLPIGVLFGYFFWQGVAGTFAHHRARLDRSPGRPAVT